MKPFVTRRRSQRWLVDATGSFPTLFIKESLVQFCSTKADFEQALASKEPESLEKIIISLAQVITVERVVTRQSYAQNLLNPDIANGIGGQQPPPMIEPLVILEPTEIPVLTSPDVELMFQIIAQGGQAPYTYAMMNAPYDLYVTTDGWVRGHIEDGWPETGFREFLILILVEDSSIPSKSAALEFRYRLYARP